MALSIQQQIEQKTKSRDKLDEELRVLKIRLKEQQQKQNEKMSKSIGDKIIRFLEKQNGRCVTIEDEKRLLQFLKEQDFK